MSSNLTDTELEEKDLSSTENMPLFCETVCMLDNFLVILLMYYLATLFVYLFCRAPNPDVPTTSEMTLRVSISSLLTRSGHSLLQLYGLNTAVIPIREKCWVSPLLVIFPFLLATLLSLPALLMKETHPLAVLPAVSLCNSQSFDHSDVYQSSVVILGYYLPAAVIIFLMICLSIRRCCNTCQAETCISSFCKEEMALSLVSLPHMIAVQALFLPNLDSFLAKLELPVTGLTEVLPSEVRRSVEMMMGLLLPIVMYCCLPAYCKFRQAPDDSDVKNEIHRYFLSRHFPSLRFIADHQEPPAGG